MRKQLIIWLVVLCMYLAGQMCLAAGVSKLVYARKFTGIGHHFASTSGNPAIGTGDFSFAFWVRTDIPKHRQTIFHTGSFEQQITKHDATLHFANTGILVQITEDQEIWVRLVAEGNHIDCVTTGDAISDLDWHHVCVTAERDNELADNVKIYVDNSLNSTTDVKDTLTDKSLTSTLGIEVGSRHITHPGAGLFPLRGALAGLRIWNAELDTDQIAADYNNGDGRVYRNQTIENVQATLHSWDLQEDSGDATDDDAEGTITLDEYGDIATISINTAGADYIVDTAVEMVGGSGRGVTIDIDSVDGGGGITGVSLNGAGRGYTVGDVLTVVGDQDLGAMSERINGGGNGAGRIDVDSIVASLPSTAGPGFHPNVVSGLAFNVTHADHVTESAGEISAIASGRKGVKYTASTTPNTSSNDAKTWGGVQTATYASADEMDLTSLDVSSWTQAYAIMSADYTSGSGRILDFRGDASLNDHHPWTSNDLYTSFFCTTRKDTTGGSTPDAEAWTNRFILELKHNGTNVSADLNGTNIIDAASTFTTTITGTKDIGNGYVGEIDVVLLYDNVPSATDQARLYDWVNWRAEIDHHYISQHTDNKLANAEADLDNGGDIFLHIDASTDEDLSASLTVPASITVCLDDPDYSLDNNSNSITFNGPVFGMLKQADTAQGIFEWTVAGDEFEFEDDETYVYFDWFTHTGETDETIRDEIFDEILYSAGSGKDICRNVCIPEGTFSWDSNWTVAQTDNQDDGIQLFGIDRDTSILDNDTNGTELIYKSESGNELKNLGVFDLTFDSVTVGAATGGAAIFLEGNTFNELHHTRVGRITSKGGWHGFLAAGGDDTWDKSIWKDLDVQGCEKHGIFVGSPCNTEWIRVKVTDPGQSGDGLIHDYSGGTPTTGSLNDLDVVIDGSEGYMEHVDNDSAFCTKMAFSASFDSTEAYYRVEMKNCWWTSKAGFFQATGSPTQSTANVFLVCENVYTKGTKTGTQSEAEGWQLNGTENGGGLTVTSGATFSVDGSGSEGIILDNTTLTATGATVVVNNCEKQGIWLLNNGRIDGGTFNMDNNCNDDDSGADPPDPGQIFAEGNGRERVKLDGGTIANSGTFGGNVYGITFDVSVSGVAQDLDLTSVTFSGNESGGINVTDQNVSDVCYLASCVFTGQSGKDLANDDVCENIDVDVFHEAATNTGITTCP